MSEVCKNAGGECVKFSSPDEKIPFCCCDAHPACGNGVKNVGEECDDGNTVSGDGCSETCQKEGIGELGEDFGVTHTSSQE